MVFFQLNRWEMKCTLNELRIKKQAITGNSHWISCSVRTHAKCHWCRTCTCERFESQRIENVYHLTTCKLAMAWHTSDSSTTCGSGPFHVNAFVPFPPRKLKISLDSSANIIIHYYLFSVWFGLNTNRTSMLMLSWIKFRLMMWIVDLKYGSVDVDCWLNICVTAASCSGRVMANIVERNTNRVNYFNFLI